MTQLDGKKIFEQSVQMFKQGLETENLGQQLSAFQLLIGNEFAYSIFQSSIYYPKLISGRASDDNTKKLWLMIETSLNENIFSSSSNSLESRLKAISEFILFEKQYYRRHHFPLMTYYYNNVFNLKSSGDCPSAHSVRNSTENDFTLDLKIIWEEEQQHEEKEKDAERKCENKTMKKGKEKEKKKDDKKIAIVNRSINESDDSDSDNDTSSCSSSSNSSDGRGMDGRVKKDKNRDVKIEKFLRQCTLSHLAGCINASIFLGIKWYQNRMFDKAIEYLTFPAEQGFPKAQMILAQCYYSLLLETTEIEDINAGEVKEIIDVILLHNNDGNNDDNDRQNKEGRNIKKLLTSALF
jgi:hypothetical protein